MHDKEHLHWQNYFRNTNCNGLNSRSGIAWRSSCNRWNSIDRSRCLDRRLGRLRRCPVLLSSLEKQAGKSGHPSRQSQTGYAATMVAKSVTKAVCKATVIWNSCSQKECCKIIFCATLATFACSHRTNCRRSNSILL